MPNARSTSGQRAPEAPAAGGTPATQRRHEVPDAFVPQGTNRNRAKVLDSGARVEDDVVTSTMIGDCGMDVWRLPGVAVRRISGVLYRPDAAGYLPELDGLVFEQSPQVKAPRPDFNFIVEVKSQSSTGSAFHKIDAAILDLAHTSDVLAVPALMVLSGTVFSDQLVKSWKAWGQLHSVVVMTQAELTYGDLLRELTRVSKERRRLARRVGVAGGYHRSKYPPAVEKGLALRIALRHASGTTLRQPAPWPGR